MLNGALVTICVLMLTYPSAQAQSLTEEDCALMSAAVDTLAKGTGLVVVDSTYISESTLESGQHYGMLWEGSYGDWTKRNKTIQHIAEECLSLKRPVILVSMKDYNIYHNEERIRGYQFREKFPGSLGAYILVSTPGYSSEHERAYLEIDQTCMLGDCGRAWRAVFLKEDSEWQFSEVEILYDQ